MASEPEYDARVPPLEELRKYKGQWIAHVGPEIVASGETIEEVVTAVREKGIRASLWRIPTSDDELHECYDD